MGVDLDTNHVEFEFQSSNFKAAPHEPHDGGELSLTENRLRKKSISEERTRDFLRDVKLGAWNCNTTPAMQTLECIQKAKRAIVEQANEEESIGTGVFAWLILLALGTALGIIMTWELVLRSSSVRNQASM